MEGQRADPWLGVEWHKGGSHAGCGELRRNTGLISAGRTHGKKSRICYNRFNETSIWGALLEVCKLGASPPCSVKVNL